MRGPPPPSPTAARRAGRRSPAHSPHRPTRPRSGCLFEGPAGNHSLLPAAGLVGKISSDYNFSISSCSNTGSIVSALGNAGGLVGTTSTDGKNSIIVSSYNTGSVKGASSAGGITSGFSSYSHLHLNIADVYNTGAIENTAPQTSEHGAGGIVGTMSQNAEELVIAGAYNVGSVTAAEGTPAGAVVGLLKGASRASVTLGDTVFYR